MADVRLPQDAFVGLLHARLSSTEKLVALAILYGQFQFAADKGQGRPIKNAEFAAMGFSGRTAERAIAHLETLGIVRRLVGGGKGVASTYAIADPQSWHTPTLVSGYGAQPEVGDGEAADTYPVTGVGVDTTLVSGYEGVNPDTGVGVSNLTPNTPWYPSTAIEGDAQAPLPPQTPPGATPTTSDVAGDRTERRRRPKRGTGPSSGDLGEGFSFEQGGKSRGDGPRQDSR